MRNTVGFKITFSDISNGREQNPIQCVNDVDASPQPNDYTYIAKSCVISGDVQIDRKVGAMLPCACEEHCTCCSCAQGWYNQGKLSANFNFLGTINVLCTHAFFREYLLGRRAADF